MRSKRDGIDDRELALLYGGRFPVGVPIPGGLGPHPDGTEPPLGTPSPEPSRELTSSNTPSDDSRLGFATEREL